LGWDLEEVGMAYLNGFYSHLAGVEAKKINKILTENS
jgi:hypothetical protein